MKSNEMTFWQIIKHIFGFHTWSDFKAWRDPDRDRPNDPPFDVFRNCEICGHEESARVVGNWLPSETIR